MSSTVKKTIDGRIVRLKLIDGTQVNGQINIKREPEYDRASDLISDEKNDFLILFGVTVTKTELDTPMKFKSMFVNKAHIIWAVPDENQK